MSKLQELINDLCPNGVEYKSLKEIGQFYSGLSGKTKKDFDTRGNKKYITYKNIFNNISINIEELECVNIRDGEKQNRVQNGDILFTTSSESREESGMSSVVKNLNEETYLNSFSFGFRCNDIELYSIDFLKHLFRSPQIRNQIIKTVNGVTRYNVSKKQFENIKIPIPPLEVQDEIVKILDKFTNLTAELTAELTAREKQIKYYKNKLLTFSEEVKSEKLSSISEFSNGKGHEKSITSDGEYIVVNSKFISTNGKVKKYTNCQLVPLEINDILLVMSDLPNGRALARTYYVEEDDKYSLNQRIGKIKVNNEREVLPKYLFYYLNRNKQLLRYDNGADQTNLRKQDILNINIFIPEIKKQKEIVSILDTYEEMITDMSTGLPAEIEARKKQYEYYRNKLLTFKEL